MRQMSKNIKNRSNSVNYLQQTVLHQRKNKLQTMIQQDRLPVKNLINYASMFTLFNDCLSIKKEFINSHAKLTLVYEILDQTDGPSPTHNIIKDEIKLEKKAQKLTLHIKKLDMVIIKNQTKHFHSISPQLATKELLIDLKIPNKIISLQIQNDQTSKKIDIDIQKLPQTIESGYKSYSVLNPLQFIEQGIKLRASKMQSAGKVKKIVWGDNSAKRIESAKIQSSLPDLQNVLEAKLTPFNENFQSLCTKKLDFQKIPQNEKGGMFSQLQQATNQNLLKQIGKKLPGESKDSLIFKINETKNKHLQMPKNKHKSKPDCTLKQKNKILEPKKVQQSQQIKKKYHSRQTSDHSQQNLQNFFNIDTQKLKQKKKSISYKTDIPNLCAFSKSIQTIDLLKRPSNKENEGIQQKTVIVKKGINSTKKIVPNNSLVGATMIKSIRMKTQAIN